LIVATAWRWVQLRAGKDVSTRLVNRTFPAESRQAHEEIM
jgi:hypothetical protein